MSEFEAGGRTYRILKLNAIQQFNVSRRIAPLIPPLVPIFLQIARSAGKTGSVEELISKPEVLQPFADGLSSLSDESTEFIFNTCLSAVRVKAGDTWMNIWNPQAKISTFEDLNDMGNLLPIVVRVIQDSLGNFISGLLTSPGTDQKAQ